VVAELSEAWDGAFVDELGDGDGQSLYTQMVSDMEALSDAS
jgi:hypothetical protein